MVDQKSEQELVHSTRTKKRTDKMSTPSDSTYQRAGCSKRTARTYRGKRQGSNAPLDLASSPNVSLVAIQQSNARKNGLRRWNRIENAHNVA